MGKDDRIVCVSFFTDLWAIGKIQILTCCFYSGAVLCIGGPYLIYYVTPTEEELFMVSFFLLPLFMPHECQFS